MRRSVWVPIALGWALAVLAVSAPSAVAQAAKSGGWLNLRLREDLPQGFAIHETATISTMWPAMPCFSNLVLFDPLKPTHSLDTVVGELAERWSWQDHYRTLVFSLRPNVKWHDGQPFSARDVKHTFDLLREAPGTAARLRINPRRDWYANVEAVEAIDAHTAVFRLKQPQPSLLLMLASGYTPIYAAHVPAASYRAGCVGTGPFKLKEWRKGDFVEYVRNPDYFISGRPHLAGLRYLIIGERGTAMAALQAGRVDAAFPGETPKPIAERLKKAVPQLVMTPVNTSVIDHLVVNTKKPPFDDARVRLALSRAVDRRALIEAVYQGAAVLGASMAPQPYGVWGLLDKDVHALPGNGKAADEKAMARSLLAEAGFGPKSPLRVQMLTRALPAFLDVASFVVGEFKSVGIDASLQPVESAQWHPLQTRGDFQVALERTGIEPDDPDANFYENYGCGSPRNYPRYCDDDVSRLIGQQSQELNVGKRLELVQSIQRKLEGAAVRPVLAWRLDYYTVWPKVKNLVPHQSIYSWGRMQEVWLDQ